MASTFSSLKIELIGTGEKVGTWGTTTNINLGTALEEAITGSADVTFASGTVTLTLTDVNTTQSARNLRLNLIGTSGGAQNLIVPAIEKLYLINNACADAITVKNSTGTGVAVAAGTSTFVYNNATNVVSAVTAAPTTIPNLTGDVTSVGVATTLTNAPVIAKVLTGYTSGAGTVAATDSILQAIQKLNGNDALKANLASPTGTGTLTWPTIVGTDATDASSSTTGALKTAGGLGVAKKAYIGTDLAVGGNSTLTGEVTKSKSAAGSDSLILLENTSTAANSGANLFIRTAGTAAGDPGISFNVVSGESWTAGIDNSDSDKFKISNSLLLGVNDCLSITTAGVVEVPLGMAFTGVIAAAADGTITKSVGSGLAIRGIAGSTNDFALVNAGGGTAIIGNTTGTLHINMGGSFGRGSPVVKTTSFTIADTENWITCNGTATITVTLPTASAYPGREIMIKTVAAFTVVSASSNVEPINTGTPGTAILAATAGKWVTLVSNGTTWVTVQAG
jgi:hypothetical protein